MKYNTKDVKNILDTYDFEFLCVIYDILDRIDDPKNEDYVIETIDCTLIYDSDQWIVMKHYQSPYEANYLIAYEYLVDDVLMLTKIL